MTQAPDYLGVADRLLATVVPGARGTWPRGTWPRGCAWLLRLALEEALDDYWQRVNPGVAACRARQLQFLVLQRYAGRALATRAGYAWWALSRAGHHHSYELGLTAAELRRLRHEVALIAAGLHPQPQPGEAINARNVRPAQADGYRP